MSVRRKKREVLSDLRNLTNKGYLTNKTIEPIEARSKKQVEARGFEKQELFLKT